MKKAYPELTPDEKKYVDENYKTMSAPAIAKALKRTGATIYAHYALHGLEPLKNTPGHAHPFRTANRRLEAVFIKRKIENRPANRK